MEAQTVEINGSRPRRCLGPVHFNRSPQSGGVDLLKSTGPKQHLGLDPLISTVCASMLLGLSPNDLGQEKSQSAHRAASSCQGLSDVFVCHLWASRHPIQNGKQKPNKGNRRKLSNSRTKKRAFEQRYKKTRNTSNNRKMQKSEAYKQLNK